MKRALIVTVTLLLLGLPTMAAADDDPVIPSPGGGDAAADDALVPKPASADAADDSLVPKPKTPDATPAAATTDDTKKKAKSELDYYKNIRVYQQRAFLKGLRVTLAPHFGMSVNDIMYNHFNYGGSLKFYFNEQFHLGGSFSMYLSDTSDFYRKIQTDFGLFPERIFREWQAMGQFGWTPLYGKANIFNLLSFHYEMYLTIGGGATKTSTGIHPSWSVGTGFHIFLLDWLTVGGELVDYMYIEDYKAGSELVNNVIAQVFVGFYIPFTFSYKYPK